MNYLQDYGFRVFLLELYNMTTKTAVDKILLRICLHGMYVIPLMALAGAIINKMHIITVSEANQYVAQNLFVLAVFIYIICFALLAVKSVGSTHGKTTFRSQVLFTLGRISLYLLLPALLITGILLLIVWLTGNFPPISNDISAN